jgi:hypothetical protein
VGLHTIWTNEIRNGAESQPLLRSQPLFLPQILPESSITMMNSIDPINGRTRRRPRQLHLRLLKKTLLMVDERDKDWLDKNNEEARGEGTSAQGAVSCTRTSSRSAKVKGKEPKACQLVTISEDEFELVMGIFEKVTHERTEYRHHVCVFYILPRFCLMFFFLFF